MSTRSQSYSSFDGEDGGFYVFNNKLYFNAFQQCSWRRHAVRTQSGFDHAHAGRSDRDNLISRIRSSERFHEFDGNLYFNEFSNAVGNDTLFKLDANGTLTPLQYQSQPLVNAGEFDGFVDFAGSTYFAADLVGRHARSSSSTPVGTIIADF